MTDMVFGTVAARPGEPVLSRWWRTLDRWTLAATVGLFLIGLLLALAASVPLAEKNNLPQFHYVIRQVVFGIVSLAGMLWLSMQNPVTIRRLGVLGFVAVFLSICALPVLGTDFGKGAVRWYSLGFISLQPSEFVKPVFVILVAWLMAASFDIAGPPGKLLSFVMAAVLAALLALQPDFGQAALVLATWGMMYFVAGASMPLLVSLAGVVSAVGFVAYNNSEHFARRIDGFLASDVDPTTQLGFATNAIREGGLFGVGVGEGTVKWRLPDAHTDFIIAVAVEEYGLVLCALIIALFLVVVLRSFARLQRERDPFARLAGTGLAALFGMQAFINIGVAIRLLPAKGMTLPLVSYGGSSLMAAGITLGFLLALTRRRPQDELTEALVEGRRR
ncbi:putative peptidoglycan glycosyltransferase FtsW [Oceanicella sp. SM1341]|uniref:peptidoglycan glycosyltransferase FtsW n=1 Tax=Oceanicella sp. SM1341 TaxID=1548889 RepID=UPI000E47F1CA|nr:putative peptidoglycan glycosyltransferase FtsW [Oceanicella sp. SM1341]